MDRSSFAAAPLLVRARRRIALRRLRERAFEIFVLGPLIIGAVLWVGERYLHLLRPAVSEWLASAPPSPFSTPSLALALALAPVLWPGALRELYFHQPLDALPVPEPSRFLVTLFSAWGQALWPTAALLGASAVLAGGAPTLPESLFLLAGVTLLACLASLSALVLMRCGWASTGRLLVVAGAAVFCAFGPIPFLRWALWPWGVAGASLHAGLGGEGVGAVSIGTVSIGTVPIETVIAVTFIAVVAALSAAHVAWRRRDLERSQASEVSAERSAPRLSSRLARVPLPAGLSGQIERRWPRTLRALLWRDVLLVARRFSPAVHLALALALTWLAVAMIAAFDPRLPLQPAWRVQALIGGATLAVLSSAAIVPFLLHKQLPVFWLEKSTGVPLEHVWSAKVWLSLLLAVPGFSIGLTLLLAFGPGPLAGRLQASGQLLLTSIVVSSLIGLASFEIATEPLIGTLWSGLVALALASLFVLYPQGWWLWLIAYGWAASEVAKRASRRVRLTEVAR